ncbi:MAG: hypothetical protein JWM93_912 [Frankiales bacterium]|nr:hypothetical protein [Frankiales bacterium]
MPPVLSPGRRAALVAGVPLILISIAWNGVNLAAFAGHTSETTTTVFEANEGHLYVDVNDGRVTLTASTDGHVHVRTTSHYGLRRPDVKGEVAATGVHVTSNCKWYDGNCSVDVDIAVPPSFTLDVDSSGGGITATGLSGQARLSSSGGSVRVTDLSGALELSSSGGNVRGSGLTSSSVVADSSGGNVDITFAAAPTHVDLDSSGGGVTVRLPADAAYAIDIASSGGSERVDGALRRDSGSPRTVLARSSGGSVSVLPTAG